MTSTMDACDVGSLPDETKLAPGPNHLDAIGLASFALQTVHSVRGLAPMQRRRVTARSHGHGGGGVVGGIHPLNSLTFTFVVQYSLLTVA